MTDRERKDYNNFKTGFTFADIFWMHRVSSNDPKDWHKGITRKVVLGKWHEIKLKMWEEYKYHYQIEYPSLSNH